MLQDKRVLLVDDDCDFRTSVSTFLVSRGFFVFPAADVQTFEEQLNKFSPDIALLDKEIGFEDGFDLIHLIRNHSRLSNLPIIMITGASTRDNKREAILIGADDLLAKPVDPEELELKILATLRRAPAYITPEQVIDVGEIKMNLKKHEISIGGKRLDLTKTEYKIAIQLLSHPGQAVNREHIALRFLSLNNSNPRTIDVHVNSLRKKMGVFGGCIKTVRGKGYMFLFEPNKAS